LTHDAESLWRRIDFDKHAVEQDENIMFITKLLKVMPKERLSSIEVYRLLPLSNEDTFFLSMGAALLGSSALEGLKLAYPVVTHTH
jgi:hypothetical protein